MMRLFARRVVFELWKRSLAEASAAAPRSKVVRISSLPHRVTLTCPFTSGCSGRKGGPLSQTEQPEEEPKINLNLWKSVMRSQTAADERRGADDEEVGKGGGQDGDASEAGSKTILEATRELVVMWRHAGKLMPEHITNEEVQMLAELPTKSSKRKYLKFLAIREGHKKANKAKQEKKRAERAAMLACEAEEGDGQGRHKLKNTFFLQYWDRSLDKLLGWRSVQAMTFGQPLVFDMSYEQNMSQRELDNTVSQLMEVEAWNRRATEPFHLHFCNLKPGGAYQQKLLKRYGTEAWDRLLITHTEHNHAEVFPHEQLVYLTADSPNVLRAFDHSKVYIVGSIVDRSILSGLSLANAKRLKLATARLPLDNYLHWGMGAKNLTLDQMIRILLTIKDTRKWEEALRFVPTRKHDGFHQDKLERHWGSNDIKNKSASQNAARDAGKFADERHDNRTFRSREHSFASSSKYSDSTGFARGRNKERGTGGPAGDRECATAITRLRSSFKNKMEDRKSTGSSRQVWWETE